MPAAQINGARISYTLLGRDGPFVVTMSGGGEPVSDIAPISAAFAGAGFRVICYERRNCGQSSLDLTSPEPEEQLWAQDLLGLLDWLQVPRAFVFGRSRTARVAIRFGLAHPDRALGFGLWGISGGAHARRILDHHYFTRYLNACETGGMASVCEARHFRQMIACQPGLRDTLLATDPAAFMATIRRWRRQFAQGVDLPIMGLQDDDLRRLTVPTGIAMQYDTMHPRACTLRAAGLIPQGQVFDFDPDRVPSPKIAQDMPAVSRIFARYFSGLASAEGCA